MILFRSSKVTIQSPVKSSKFQVLSSKLFVTFGTNYIAYGQISLRTWNLELKTLSDPSGKGTTTEQILVQNDFFGAVPDAVHPLHPLYLVFRFHSLGHTFGFRHLTDHHFHPLMAYPVNFLKMGEQLPGNKTADCR